MKNNNEENKDVFHDAALESALGNAINKSNAAIVIKKQKEELLTEIARRVEEGETQWDILKRMIESDYTDRFMKAMDGMGDKDFVKNYLKLLEHFKPKLVRATEGEIEKPDVTVNIQTVIINKEGEKEIIDITDLQNE